MEKHLGKDHLTDSLEKFENFESYERDSKDTIAEYIANFDQKYNRLVKLKMNLPSPILAFKLLRKATINKSEKLLVLTGMDYKEKKTLYEQATKSLLKFKGEQGARVENQPFIKTEPAFLTEHEMHKTNVTITATLTSS